MKKQRLLLAWALLSVASLQAAVSSTTQLNRVIRLVKSLQTPGALAKGQATTSVVTPVAVKIYSIPATFAALKVAIPSMTVASSTASTASADNAAKSFNINVKANVGYAFFSNPWDPADPVVPGFAWSDISSYLSDGITFVLLGFDKNMNVILDFTKQAPTAMSLLIYDTKTGALIKSIPFDPKNDATSGSTLGTASFTPNTIELGELDLASVPLGTYPVAFPVTFA